MQVTLHPVDWGKLTRFPSGAAFIEWMFDTDDDALPDDYDPGAGDWASDSATHYFDVAEALTHIGDSVDAVTSQALSRGLGRILCENGHVDDFGTGPASDGTYWISASPDTTRDIWAHARATDWGAVTEALRANPPKFGNLRNEIDTVFVPVVEQHLRMVEWAAARGYGLMGHCG